MSTQNSPPKKDDKRPTLLQEKRKKLNDPKNEDQIFKPPVILRQPNSKNAVVGGRCIFQISGTGLPMPSYQWFHNGNKIGGAIGNRLVLPKVRQADVGLYSCEVKNMVGSVMSKNCSLMIVRAAIPDFSIEPKVLSVKPGERVLFTIKPAANAVLNLTQYEVQWFCNERKIRGANKLELDIKKASPSLAGSFAAKISLRTNSNAYRVSEAVNLKIEGAASKIASLEKPQTTEVKASAAPEAKPTPPEPAPVVAAVPLSTPESDEAFFDFGAELITKEKPAKSKKQLFLENALERLEFRKLANLKPRRRAKRLEKLLLGLSKLRDSRRFSKAG